MYTAIILGRGEQYRSDTLDSLLLCIERNRYTIIPEEKRRLELGLSRRRSVLINLDRRRTKSEMMKEQMRKHFRNPYLPLKTSKTTERMMARIEYRGQMGR